MAYDGIFLHSVISSIKTELIGRKIDKINQPEKDEIHITFRNLKKKKLLISAGSNYPRIALSDVSKPNPMVAPMFCMVLRKYLLGGRVLDIVQYNNDRFLFIDIESTDEMGFDSVYRMYIEIMGRHSNITLVRLRDNKIMDCIKHITSDISRSRILIPGLTFEMPPLSNRIDPFNFTEDDKSEVLNKDIENSSFFSKTFNGIGKQFSSEIYHRLNNPNKFTSEVIHKFKYIIDSIDKSPSFSIFYDDNHIIRDFYVTNLTYLSEGYKKDFDDINILMDSYYTEKDKQDRLSSKACDLTKLVKTNIDRCIKKNDILERELKECESKDKYKICGELLTSYIYTLKQGMDKVVLQNYYDNNNDYEITLDPHKSPSENVQKYFKKYNKLKKTEVAGLEQLEHNEKELEYLNSVMTSISNAEEYSDIDDIKSELIESGYIKFSKGKNKKKDKSKPMHFISSDGIDIYVGKNNIQNDYLTLKFADKRDTWLHSKTIPGSHVIIKSFDVPDTTLEEAAHLAAYYSKGKNSSKVEIDYTQVKNVKKPSGAKPGMVIYYTNSTIISEPIKPNITQIK